MSKPFYYIWVYDAQNDEIILSHNEGIHPADTVTPTDLIGSLPSSPDTEAGYAYRIAGAWRITTEDHKEVEDPHILDLIKKQLRIEDKDQI